MATTGVHQHEWVDEEPRYVSPNPAAFWGHQREVAQRKTMGKARPADRDNPTSSGKAKRLHDDVQPGF
jgi:hypothetical protein